MRTPAFLLHGQGKKTVAAHLERDQMGELKRGTGEWAFYLCIDMQRLFAVDGPRPVPQTGKVKPKIAKSSKALQRAIHTVHPGGVV
jgi:hypothetical protein